MIYIYTLGIFFSSLFLVLVFLKFIEVIETPWFHKFLYTILITSSALLVVFSSLPQIQYLLTPILLVFIGRFARKKERMSLIIFLSFFVMLLSSFLNYFEEILEHLFFSPLFDNTMYVTSLNIFFLCLNILFVKLIPNVYFNHIYDFLKYNRYLYPDSVLIAILLVIFSELTLGANSNNFINNLFLNNQKTMFAVFTVVLFSLILVIEFGSHQREHNKTKILLNNLANYNNEIERLNEELAMFRHDYLNLLHTLKISIDSQNLDEIESIYYHLLAPTEKYLRNTDDHINSLCKIKNVEIKSLLSYKVNYAKKKGIKFHLSINNPIFFSQQTNFIILIRMLSILLDNAIDNSLKGELPQIELSIMRTKSIATFIIENTYDINENPEENIFKYRYTSKDDSLNHGLGLSYVKNVVKNQTEYDLETEITPVRFKQILTIITI